MVLGRAVMHFVSFLRAQLTDAWVDERLLRLGVRRQQLLDLLQEFGGIGIVLLRLLQQVLELAVLALDHVYDIGHLALLEGGWISTVTKQRLAGPASLSLAGSARLALLPSPRKLLEQHAALSQRSARWKYPSVRIPKRPAAVSLLAPPTRGA